MAQKWTEQSREVVRNRHGRAFEAKATDRVIRALAFGQEGASPELIVELGPHALSATSFDLAEARESRRSRIAEEQERSLTKIAPIASALGEATEVCWLNETLRVRASSRLEEVAMDLAVERIDLPTTLFREIHQTAGIVGAPASSGATRSFPQVRTSTVRWRSSKRSSISPMLQTAPGALGLPRTGPLQRLGRAIVLGVLVSRSSKVRGTVDRASER